MNKGKFIVFEGMDGTGKSTQIKLLAEALSKNERECLVLREPGGTPPGEQMREILKHSTSPLSSMTELLLMNASRAQLVSSVIKPALEAGKDVLLDRYFYSTIAYQAFGRELPFETVKNVIDAAIQGCEPTHLFLIKIPLSTCLERRSSRQANLPFKTEQIDRFEAENQRFFAKVEAGYAYVEKQYNPIIIDGHKSIPEIHELVLKGLA